MSEDRPPDDTAEITIAAPPSEVWAMVSDVTRMGEWSPECHRCVWLDGGTGPRVGARFKGWNEQKVGPLPVRWSTTSTVTEAVPGERFAFRTKQSGVTWAYRFHLAGDGATQVVETRTESERPPLAKVFNAVMPDRRGTLQRGMTETLDRLKSAAERPG